MGLRPDTLQLSARQMQQAQHCLYIYSISICREAASLQKVQLMIDQSMNSSERERERESPDCVLHVLRALRSSDNLPVRIVRTIGMDRSLRRLCSALDHHGLCRLHMQRVQMRGERHRCGCLDCALVVSVVVELNARMQCLKKFSLLSQSLLSFSFHVKPS